MIVENHRDLLDPLGEALGLMGWETILAESGREAMNNLKDDLPSAVFLDLGTPLMNSLELAASLKAHPVYKQIPILAAGGHSGDLIRQLCLAAGCDDFISKPLVFAELGMRLNSLWFLERRKTICAGEPVNMVSDGWKLNARGGSRRKVA